MARPLVSLAVLAASLAFGSFGSVAQTAAAGSRSIVPVQQTVEWAAKWWMPRHEEKLAEAKARGSEARLLFIGDSITHFWDEGLWAERFGKYGAFNLGFSGDRTEHVLWRIEQGALDNLSPEVTVIMIGTNNTGQDEGQPASETVQGIAAILDQTRARLPDTKILLLAVFPRGEKADDSKRLVNDEINAALPALAEAKGADFLNINSVFLEKDGTLPRSVMPDALHPKKTGYRLWADAMKDRLSQYFGDAPAKAAPTVVSLWNGDVPAPHDATLKETVEVRWNAEVLTNIGNPSFWFYPAKGRGARATVLVCPGGGYNILSFDKEGLEIAEWLNSFGFSAAVLKYRVPKNREGALQDAQRALGLLRHRAAEWNIDPSRIGVLGFSAGGHLSASLASSYKERSYPARDAADAVSCRPDYTVLVYPAYMGTDALELTEGIVVDADTPPAFIVQTQDDTKYVASSLAYYTALFKTGIPSELHLYPEAGHGYGMRPSAYPVSRWPDLCRDWLLNR